MSKIDKILDELINSIEWCVDAHRLSDCNIDRAKEEKAKKQAKRELCEAILNGVMIDGDNLIEEIKDIPNKIRQLFGQE